MKKMTEKQRLELEARYNGYIHEQCGILHNQIVAWVSESKVPLIQVMLVLEMLLEECKRECFKKYLEE